MSKAVYEIRVLGEIPPRVFDDFDRVTVAVDPMETLVRADLVDEAELQGILEAIRRSARVLIDVRREQDYE